MYSIHYLGAYHVLIVRQSNWSRETQLNFFVEFAIDITRANLYSVYFDVEAALWKFVIVLEPVKILDAPNVTQ